MLTGGLNRGLRFQGAEHCGVGLGKPERVWARAGVPRGEEPRGDAFVRTPECKLRCKVTPWNDSASLAPRMDLGWGFMRVPKLGTNDSFRTWCLYFLYSGGLCYGDCLWFRNPVLSVMSLKKCDHSMNWYRPDTTEHSCTHLLIKSLQDILLGVDVDKSIMSVKNCPFCYTFSVKY